MKRSTLGALILILPLTAIAGVDDEMNTMFNRMSAVNDPVVHMGARRGVISGGGYAERYRVSSTRPLSFTAPRVSAGCGGIDSYMGAFSFINTDQMVAMLRQIASNAKGYAFQIAINAVSPMIREELGSLSEKIQKWTEFEINSCQIAQQAMQPFATWANAAAAGSRRQGASGDALSASSRGSGESTASLANREAPEALQGTVISNVVWESLKRTNAASAFANGDDGLLEELMSITGTVISCIPGQDGCGAAVPTGTPVTQGEPMAWTEQATLRLLDLVQGSRGSDGHGKTPVRILRCNDRIRCLAPRHADITITGFEERVRRVLLGAQNRPGQGIVGRFARLDGRPSSQEEAILTSLGSFGAKVLNIARLSEQAAREYCEAYLRPLTTEIVFHMMRDMLESVDSSVSVSGAPLSDQVQAQIRDAREQLDRDYTTQINRIAALDAMLTSYVHTMSSLRPSFRDLSAAQPDAR